MLFDSSKDRQGQSRWVRHSGTYAADLEHKCEYLFLAILRAGMIGQVDLGKNRVVYT